MVVRFAGIASAAMVMPVALAMAATSYTGIPRATAIGIAYAAYGAGPGALADAGRAGPGHLRAGLRRLDRGLRARARGRPGPHPRAPEADRGRAAVRVRDRVVGLRGGALRRRGSCGSGPGSTTRCGSGSSLGGIALVAAFIVWERRRRAEHAEAVRIERRPVTIALFVGLVIAIAQIVPMSQLPLYFGVGMRYGPIFGILALVPLFAALVVAGPVAGFLLARFRPRILIAGGVLVIGVGDLLVAALIGPTTTYVAFIIPLILIGGGFVVATTVRTAIIFASVPRGLPATAAALNEASIEVGTRAGIVVVTGIVAEVAIAVYTASVAGQPQAQVDGLVATFREVLVALGTPSFQSVAQAVQPADLADVPGRVLRRGPGRAARGRGGGRGRLDRRLAHARSA